MRYLKIILTIIALLLAVQVAVRILPSARAVSAQDVNIAAVGGKLSCCTAGLSQEYRFTLRINRPRNTDAEYRNDLDDLAVAVRELNREVLERTSKGTLA